jgi:hypothetical protein
MLFKLHTTTYLPSGTDGSNEMGQQREAKQRTSARMPIIRMILEPGPYDCKSRAVFRITDLTFAATKASSFTYFVALKSFSPLSFGPVCARCVLMLPRCTRLVQTLLGLAWSAG